MSNDAPREKTPDAEIVSPAPATEGWADLWKLEDWWAVWLGGIILAVALGMTWKSRPDDWAERLAHIADQKREVDRAQTEFDAAPTGEREPLSADLESRKRALKDHQKALADFLGKGFKSLLAKPKDWTNDPRDAIYKSADDQSLGYDLTRPLVMVWLVSLFLFGTGLQVMGQSYRRFATAFLVLFAFAVVSFILANHKLIKYYNLEYPLWGLLVGLSISNTLGTPRFLQPAVRTEFYIKTGLVLLGAEVLLSQLVQLGLPGIFISWVVTPIVLVATFVFGQRVLKIESKTLNIVVSADMSVCGVSAAIATAAACRAKKEELSLAIGISLAFTVVMMIVMPKFIQFAGIDRAVGAAWIGGTIDATGAVAAAGEILGKDVLPVAVTVKMIQNILIGVIAFGVAVYWVTYEERAPNQPQPTLWEIWYRFPKFILGFVAASAVFSYLYSGLPGGEYLVKAAADGCTKTLREWFFCLAFVSIGLESNFRELAGYLKGGKPLVLYVVGQAFSLALSLFMCWLMLQVVFPNATAQLTR